MAEKIACIAIAALILLAMVLYYFGMPHNTIGWLALIVLGIPTVLGFEWLGEWSSSSRPVKYIEHWPAAAKIPVLVLLFLLLLALAAPVVWLIHHLIAS